MARLFFALWPSRAALAPLGALAAKLAADCGGRAVVTAKIHLTLAFLGEVDGVAEARAREVADSIAFEPFDLVLDRIGSFPKAHVAWAGPSALDPRAGKLATGLADRLQEAGFKLERHRPFAAHVTLARRIRQACAEAPIAPIAWTADRFSLVESDLRSGRYRKKGSWGERKPR